MTVKINHFDHNVTVTHIGGLFKGSKSKIWSINLQCSPKQEKKFTNFSNAAMLIRGKKLNCSERQLSKPNLVITLSDQNFLTSLLKILMNYQRIQILHILREYKLVSL
jgi:hypothetical protein